MKDSEIQLNRWARWEPSDHQATTLAMSRLARRLPVLFRSAPVRLSERCELPFYESLELLRITVDRNGAPRQVHLLHGLNQTLWLSGDSGPIHLANSLQALSLSDITVESYLRFFLSFLRSDHGSLFSLIESPHELGDESTDNPEAHQMRQALEKAIIPLRLRGYRDGLWVFDASTTHRGVLYVVAFSVSVDGDVTMIDDDPIGAVRTTL